MFHNTRLSGNVNWQATRNPPLQLNPQIFYGSVDTLLQSTGYNFPSDVQGFENETRTPTLYGYSIGVQRDIGWGTVVDAAFVGSQSRNLLQTRNLNIVPYGAHFLATNQDPTRANVALPDNFYRPYPGYANVWFFENSGKADYQALQLQANRRFKKGLQFGVAYTLSRSRDYSSNNETGTGTNMQIATYQNPDTWNWGLSSYDQTHVAVINYTWICRRLRSLEQRVTRRARQLAVSGLTTLASGTPVRGRSRRWTAPTSPAEATDPVQRRSRRGDAGPRQRASAMRRTSGPPRPPRRARTAYGKRSSMSSGRRAIRATRRKT